MERVADQEDIDIKAPTLGRTPYEILIIASMIEREAKTRRRPRQDRPGHLQPPRHRDAAGRSTPRVRYGTEQAGVDPDASRSSQRQTPGPYNTYLNQGLPPTPIANPGRASIRAALNPAPNPSVGDPLCAGAARAGTACMYLYYVLADEEGNHAFAVTAEQHQANVARGRRRRPALTDAGVQVAAVIGHPVAALAVAGAAQRGVRAPAGLDWRYVAFDVAAGSGRRRARRDAGARASAGSR